MYLTKNVTKYFYIGGIGLIFLLISLILIVLIILVLMIKIKINVSILYTDGKCKSTIKTPLFNKTYQLSIDTGKLTDESSNLYPSIIRMKNDVTSNLRNIYVHHIAWTTHIGCGEAYATGLVLGPMWTVKGIVIGFISRHVNGLSASNVHLLIEPYFTEEKLQSEVNCIGSIRIGKAIYTLIKRRKMNTQWIRRRQNGRTPD